MSESSNVASHLSAWAVARPDQLAVVEAARHAIGRKHSDHANKWTYRTLDALCQRYASALSLRGVQPGARILLMVRPGGSFIALVFALFRMSAIPVMIDPGMGIRRMLDCLQSVSIDGLIGIPRAHVLRLLRPSLFQKCRVLVTVGKGSLPGSASLDRLTESSTAEFPCVDVQPEALAAILFTSGATGPAKGVEYEHGMFNAQIQMIQTMYEIEVGEVDVSCFPLFGLFSVAMGMTSVVPAIDPSRPARTNPARVVDAIQRFNATSAFGSPALWKRVGSFCREQKVQLPSLRRILMAGAPVPPSTIESLHHVLSSNADVYTPYGATEALPVASIGGRDLMREHAEQTRSGAGTCVGHPVRNVDVRVMRICDDAVEHWSDELLIRDGEMGEIVASGPPVTKRYHGLENATSRAKIVDGNRVWHRMGDVGYRDPSGRLWFCGRKTHRVVTLSGVFFADQCEAIFNTHEDVERSALVGVVRGGLRRLVLVVETRKGYRPRSRAKRLELANALAAMGHSRKIPLDAAAILFRRSLPVDVRHNAKINRELLARWANTRLRG